MQVQERESAPPARYTPKHLAEKILAGRDALAGERKQVTVLFADVVGSTSLIRDRDPEESQRLLDGATTAMMRGVHRYEGTVSRLMGDGLMAMFGAPIAHEDHAVRACYAALAMLESIQAYAEEARRSFGETVQVRIGLNSGEVIVRLISDDLHMDYTAMGPTVHLAARMEGLAAAGTTVLSASTLALVEGLFDVRPLGPMPVKGLDQPIPVYELTGTGAARTRLQAAAARGLTRFVGRDDERIAIERALARARVGQGQVVALVGEPGVGKSRLVWEIAHTTGADGWTVLKAGAVSYGKAVPYLPLVNLLKAYFRIEAPDRPEAIVEKVTARLLALDATLLPGRPALLALLDMPVQDDPWQALDPPGRRRATLDAIARLLLRESREQPLLLAVEDLHWLDAESQALLDGLVESLPAARIVLLVNYRPEYTHTWGNKSSYTQLRIDVLGRAGAEELLAALLGDAPAVQELKALTIARTEGNPFFLEESVRTLVETGALVGERGAYRLARPIDRISIPATVESVLAARIDRLPNEEKRLLQMAAAIGKDLPYALLQAIVETPEERLRTALARLQAGELLYPVSLFPELELTFKHALTHDVAYGSLLQDRRKTLHGQIVRAIERLYPDRLDEHVERLAHHATRGEMWEAAVVYSRQVGEKAMARSAYREAAGAFDRAIRSIEHLPESRATREQAIDVRLALRAALSPMFDQARMLGLVREAETIAVALGDERRLAHVLAPMAFSLQMLGESDAAIDAARRAVRLADARGDVQLQVHARHTLGQIHLGRGEYRLAVTAFERILDLLQEDVLQVRPGTVGSTASEAHAMLALCLMELGALDDAIEHGVEAVRIADTLNLLYSRCQARVILGWVELGRGRVRESVRVLEVGLELGREGDFRNQRNWAAARLGFAYALTQRSNAGLALLEQALEDSERACIMHGRSLWLSHLAEGYLLAGRVAEAATRASQALDLAVARTERGYRVEALRVLAEIAARRTPPDLVEAEARYREALALAEELEMRPLLAHCYFGLGKLYRRAGRAQDARAALHVALDLYRSMGMRPWISEAEAELAQSTSA